MDIVKFVIDQKKNTITYYVRRKEVTELWREAKKHNKSKEFVADVLTRFFAEVTKKICDDLKIDMNKLKPNVKYLND